SIAGNPNTSTELLTWYNLVGSLRYRRVWSDRFSQTVTAGKTTYDYTTGNTIIDRRGNGTVSSSLFYDARISEYILRSDFILRYGQHNTLRLGAGLASRSYQPGAFTNTLESTVEENNFSRDTTFKRAEAHNLEHSLYFENIMQLGAKVSLNLGARLAWIDGKYPRIQPRLSLGKKFGKQTTVKASFSTIRQNAHLLVSGNLGVPRDLWIPITSRLPPQDSWQVALGLEKLIKNTWKVTTELYYKSMDGVVNYRPGAGVLSVGNFDDLALTGQGEAYGLEFQLQRSTGRLTGQLSHTLSWSWRTFAGINQGNRFPYRYDRRHNLSLTANYILKPQKIQLNLSFVYQSGNPVTLTSTEVAPLNQEVEVTRYLTFDEVNGYRIPPTNRLDLGISFSKKKKKRERIISLGLYNAYARRNPYYVTVRQQTTGDGRRLGQLVKVNLFRVVPSISYSLKW
ncbi:MAG: TonB-dependent receptor, partial [Bacteroidota bacterium]